MHIRLDNFDPAAQLESVNQEKTETSEEAAQ
jgi:hypothetical protein